MSSKGEPAGAVDKPRSDSASREARSATGSLVPLWVACWRPNTGRVAARPTRSGDGTVVVDVVEGGAEKEAPGQGHEQGAE
eukprot:7421370-Heterocapsa_arctica.AAC.1